MDIPPSNELLCCRPEPHVTIYFMIQINHDFLKYHKGKLCCDRGFSGVVLPLVEMNYKVLLVLPEKQSVKKALVAAAQQGAVFSWASVASGNPRKL